MNEAPCSTTKGDRASRTMARAAVGRSSVRLTSFQTSNRPSPTSSGLTNHGTPAVTPAASSSGQPGGKIP